MLWNIKIKPNQNLNGHGAEKYMMFLVAYNEITYDEATETEKNNPFVLNSPLYKELKGNHDIVNEFIVDAGIEHINRIFSQSKPKDSEYDIWNYVKEVTITKIDEKEEINKLRGKIDDLKDELSKTYSDNLKDIQSREREVNEGIIS